MELNDREQQLLKKQERLDALERQIDERERAIKKRESEKKQVLLRLSPTLWSKVAAWADEDFRSINAQIEFLLAESVKEHYGK